MKYSGAQVFLEKSFVAADFEVENGVFTAIVPSGTFRGDATDLTEKYVIPGLIDCHIHGAVGVDYTEADAEGLLKMSHYLAKEGITSFTPANITIDYETLSRAFAVGLKFHKEMPMNHSRLMGIHMEGPYFSEKKKGAHNSAFLKNPDIDGFLKLYNDCEGLIKIVDIAPELPGAVAFAEEISKLTRVSVAHTNASYEEASRVFDSGATHLTHLYNGMPSIHHREPGVIGAASERDSVIAELICDGYHVHESAVRMAFKMFPGRICLISDGLNCLGMPDGIYGTGWRAIELSDGYAKMKETGTIAGSATNVYNCMLNAIRFGMDPDECILAATITPARQIGCADVIGSIEVGKYADFNVCDKSLHLEETYIGGNKVQ